MTLAKLNSLARAELDRTVAALPEPLRAPAATLLVTLHDRPNEAQLLEGIEPDVLGLFVGASLMYEREASAMQPQIILFLGNLWDEVEGDVELFLSEVRTTYLHELGHFLGLDEDDLADRGL